MGRLDNKVVVILGASDEKSMGAACARRFAKEGAKLILAARQLDKLEPIAKSVGAVATDASMPLSIWPASILPRPYLK
jgi:NADP-dependent 3-hydroxy acid dehydrogenase YdfG